MECAQYPSVRLQFLIVRICGLHFKGKIEAERAREYREHGPKSN